MSEQQNPAPSELDLGGLESARFQPSQRRILWRAALVIAVMVAAAVAVPWIAYTIKRDQVVAETGERLTILAAGRVEVLETWLHGLLKPTSRLVESDLIRLFATEVDNAGGSLSAVTLPHDLKPDDGEESELGVPLVDQLPFIERVLSDFALSAGFLDGHIFARGGDSYVTTAGATPSNDDQQALALKVFKSGQPGYGSVRVGAAGLVIDIARPIIAAQTEIDGGQVVAVLVLVTPIANALAEHLAPLPLAAEGERLWLVEVAANGGGTLIDPGASPPLKAVTLPGYDQASGRIPFATRDTLAGDGAVFSYGQRVLGPDWLVVQERSLSGAKQSLDTYARAAGTIAALVVAALVIAFGAFWWRLANEHNRSRAEQYRSLSARILAQKRLLDSINNTIAEHIGLKGSDGAYRYVNPAFAEAMGRDVESVTGLDDAALYGAATAERLALGDERARRGNSVVTSDEEIYLNQKHHYMQISKVPYQGENPEDKGIVSVLRDVTDLVEEQKKREHAIQQMVGALVRAIELRDPYLAGHSRRVAAFAGAVAKRLEADAEEVMTVEIAAHLSQVGKLKVSREILTKPERLEGAEIEEMQQHLKYAAEVLKDIEFDLPVLATIYQMHERLDGTGYPKGLAGNAISRSARILGACDVFCARVEPRSYRSVISPDNALAILAEHSGRYDSEVVAALDAVVSSIAGEKLLASIHAA